MSARVVPADDAVRAGRLRKARQFAQAAEDVLDLAGDDDEVGDVYVSLCVLAGIAAADAICASRLGRYSRGEDHRQAVDLLRSADPEASRHLARLLAFKTEAAYGHRPMSGEKIRQAGRAIEHLLGATT